MTQRLILPFVVAMFLVSSSVLGEDDEHHGKCQGLPSEAQLRQLLATAPTSGGTVGGLFDGTRMCPMPFLQITRPK
jgi:hypothetical protein